MLFEHNRLYHKYRLTGYKHNNLVLLFHLLTSLFQVHLSHLQSKKETWVALKIKKINIEFLVLYFMLFNEFLDNFVVLSNV